ncbi:MAG: TerC family protein [Thermogutta sp.]|nr:TerC family protein [Thermogutta sp.]
MAAVVVALFLDLVVFHRKEHAPSLRESFYWSVFWIGLALLFNAYVWWWGYRLHGTSEAGVKFLTAYVVEKSLSVDNLFVFAVIFRYFGVNIRYQHRILFWGILGAIITRGLFIIAGVELIRMFEWLIAVFGLFLCYTGARLAFASGEEVHPEKNIILRFARRIMRVTPEIRYDRFLIRRDGLLYVTPAFLALLVIESTDVLFAVDSIPAVLGISRDPFIVYSSNIGAILGLRALYFLLAGVLERFRYLHYGLAVVLVFIGLKMVAEYVAVTFMNHHGHLIDPWVSLAVVGGILGASLLPTLFVKQGANPDGVDRGTLDE